MPIPKYSQLLRPLLALAAKQDLTRRDGTEAMSHQFDLTEKECALRIPSGTSTYIRNRTGWAMTFLTKGALIEKVAKATYRATPAGHTFLDSHPTEILNSDLKQIEGWEEAWGKGREASDPDIKEEQNATADSTPLELLGQSSKALNQALRAELLDHLANVNPYRFEQIVVDVLFAMGYGGSREEAAQVTSKSNDEGIDGVINEDRLGLDVIYVQAKRWQNNVGRKEVQSFVGALAGKQAHKGVFITTSNFADSAHQYAKNVSQRVVLIDGNHLAELMIEHNVGVAVTETISVKRTDSDYFEDA